jgi:hypothetical protein
MKPMLTKVTYSFKDAFMLSRARHHVIAPPARRPSNALQCNIVRFGRTVRKHNLFRPSSNQVRDLCPSVFDRSPCAAARHML